MQFNHVAHRVHRDSYAIVVSLMKDRLGFIELRRTERSIWLRQPGSSIDLQLSLSDATARDADKRRSQISFLSEAPEAALEDIAAWARNHGLAVTVGRYSDKEFYLDAPEAFVDFVIEAMTPDLADYSAAQTDPS